MCPRGYDSCHILSGSRVQNAYPSEHQFSWYRIRYYSNLLIFFQAAWQRLKAKLPAVFAEGLDNYDVARLYQEDVFISRPTLAKIEAGWKPRNTLHLEGEAEAREEQESMEAYYRYRSQFWH